MTVAIFAKVPEGIVLGSDSTTTIYDNQGRVINTYDNVQKIFPIENHPVGIVTWGIGSIGVRNIESLIHEFETTVTRQRHSIQNISMLLFNFFRERYLQQFTNPQNNVSLGFVLAGYDTGASMPTEYIMEIPNTAPHVLRPNRADGTPNFGLHWFGQPWWITRLIKGFDHRWLNDVATRCNIPLQELENLASRFEVPIPYDGMPLQDAVDLTEFLINITIGVFKFQAGPKLCGGAVDIAVITPKGFCWIKQKALFRQIENHSRPFIST